MEHIARTGSVDRTSAPRRRRTAKQAQSVETRVGKLDFELGVPTKATVAKLYDELDFQRACQLYLWALPAVSAAQARLYTQFVTGGRDGDVALFEGYRSNSRLLTANVTTPYVGGGFDLAEKAPMVPDVPAGLIAGSVMDLWQRPLTDFGLTGRMEARAPGTCSWDRARRRRRTTISTSCAPRR